MTEQVTPVTTEEVAEVIDLINELESGGSLKQALGLCRTVADLANTPELSLHGIHRLISVGDPSDRRLCGTALEKIAEQHPQLRWIQFRCGVHFSEIEQFKQSIDCYLRSISLKPTAKSHFNLARTYRKVMQFEPAIAHYESTLQLNPKHQQAAKELLYLMSMKGNLQRFGELEPVCSDDQNFLASCYNRLGQTLVYQGDRVQAMKWFDKAIGISPDSFSYQWSKHLTVPTIYRNQEDLAASRKQYLAGLETIAAMYQTLPGPEKDQAHSAAQKLTNFEIHYQSENDMEVQRPYGALFHSIMSHSFPRYTKPLPRRHPGNARRIRVGFASWGCFFTHSNYKTHGSWLTELNKERFEVFGYALATNKDSATRHMADSLEHFLPFSGNAGGLRQQIVKDDLDILVYPGIGMEPIVHRLAPLRLAPVQCTSWGHPVTSGLPNIDYFLSSELMEPDNAQQNYTETLIKLPNLGISQIAPGLPSQYRAPEILAGRPRPGTVFLCSQNILKMMPQHDFLFARILQAVPDSEIQFIASKRQDITDTFRKRLAKTCQSYGVDFDKRCLLLPRLGKAEFCYVNEHADVMLDTSFWSGCNTTFETLVHRTPVITLPGNTMRGRHTAAILQLHGLTELIAGSETEYVDLATRLATDSGFHQEIQQKIDAISGQLFGDETVIKALESFFERSLTGDA